MRFLSVAALVSLVASACAPTNPFDPATPSAQQAKGKIKGTVELHDAVDPATRTAELQAMTVGLLDDAGLRLKNADNSDLATALNDLDDGTGADHASGKFEFPAVVPGNYRVVVDGAPSFYTPPTFPNVHVNAGATADAGAVVFTFVQNGDKGPGAITGEIKADGGALGQASVQLFTKSGDAVTLAHSLVSSSAFSFDSLTVGTYALVVESDGFMPSYRRDIEIGGTTQALSIDFSGPDAIVLFAVDAVLVPVAGAGVTIEDGVTYVNVDTLPLNVLTFGADAVGITGMRLATDATFVDGAGAEIPFVPYTATTSIALPAAEGTAHVFAQFQSASSGSAFTFTSNTFSIDAVHDTVAPRVIAADLNGLTFDTASGAFLANTNALSVHIEATDDTSAVDGLGIGIGSASPSVVPEHGPPGLVRFDQAETIGADGLTSIFVTVVDRAGNATDPVEIPVLVDRTAPDVSLVVTNAAGGVLATRTAQLDFDEAGHVNDLPVAYQVRVVGQSFGEVIPYGTPATVIIGDATTTGGGSDGDTVHLEARAIDRVGNAATLPTSVVLHLEGTLSGAVDAEGIPLIASSPAGAVVTLSRVGAGAGGADVVVGSQTLTAGGAFAFLNVPEGAPYSLAITFPGWRDGAVGNLAIPTPAPDGTAPSVDVGTVRLDLARGDLAGRFRRSDVVADDTAHAGIVVTATLAATSAPVAPLGARTFTTSTVTDAKGDFALSGLPATRSNEHYTLEARHDGYSVAVATANALAADVLTTLPQVLLPKNTGDFDICRPTGPTGPCTPVSFVNTNSVKIQLRDATGVTKLHVSINGGAETTVNIAADNATLASLQGAVDGVITVQVRSEKSDGTFSAPLTSTVTRDTVPPTGAAIARTTAPLSVDPRFTNQTFVDVTLTADAGTGAPLDAARVVVSDVAPPGAPAAPPAPLACAQGALCRVNLPVVGSAVQEKVQHIFGVACDQALNCAAPVQTFVIFDATPPASTNGAGFSVDAPGSVVDASGALPVVVLPSSFYDGTIALGTAHTGSGGGGGGGGAAVVDEAGAPVADVFAWRVSTSAAALSRAALQTPITPPVAGEARNGSDVAVPGLQAVATTQTVFASLIDAAGNVSAPFSAALRIDVSPPAAIIVVNGGAPTASASVPFTLTVPANGEAPTSLSFSVDDGAAQAFALPLTGAERITLPNVEGSHRVAAEALDAVGNIAHSESTIVLDKSGPRVDVVRCVSAGCVDTGVGTILTNAVNGRIDLAVTASDTLTTAVAVEISFDAGPPVSFPINGVTQVLVPLNAASSMSVVAVDSVGNHGAAFLRPVVHDTVAPVITSFTLDGGAARTNAVQVALHTDVAAGDAVDVRYATTASFSGGFATFRADDFFVVAGADGLKQICVQVRDAAQNASSTCASITLDRAAPAGTVAVAGGVALTRSTTVALTLTYPADTTGVAVSRTALTCDPATTSYVSATGSPQSASVIVDAGDGTRPIFACFVDGAGNFAPATTSIVLDQTPPDVVAVLDGGAPFSIDNTVGLDLDASADVAQMSIGIDTTLDCATATYVPFQQSSTVTIPATEASHSVSVCVADVAGNKSAAPGSASIFEDRTDPTGSIVLDGDVPFTKNTSVTAVITRASDVVSMAVDVNLALNCATASYTAFQPAATIAFTGANGSDGLKTVQVCLKDAAGRTARFQDTITLDRTAPSGTIVVAGGAATTPVRDVTAALTFSADTTGVAVSAFPLSCDTAIFTAPQSTVNVSLAFVGQNTVTACLQDAAGNTAAITDDIFLEDNAGDTLVVAIEGGSAIARSRNVNVSLFRPSTNFTLMKVVEAPTLDCADLSGYVAFASTAPLTLSAGSAPFEGNRTVSACVRDPIADVNKGAGDSIFLDSFVPSGAALINGGAAVSASATVTVAITNDFAAQNEIDTVALSEASTIVGADCSGSFEAFQGTKSFTFSGADGTHSVFVCLRDGAGNTKEVTDNIVVDRTAPSPVSVSVAPLGKSTTVNATITFPNDAVKVALAEGALDCLTTPAYVPVPGASPAVIAVTIAAIDGAHTIFACFEDAAGNATQATAVTSLDRTAPSATVVLNNGDAFTTVRPITVALQNASGDVTLMSKVDSTGGGAPDCNAATYEAFQTSSSFTLTSAGDGSKTVNVCLQDAAGNRALALADTIGLDTGAPNGTVVIDGGNVATKVKNVTLTLGTGGAVDVVSFAAAEGSIACNAANLPYAPFAGTAPFLLSSGDGTKTVLVCFKDSAGNVSTVTASDTIVLDTAAPSLPAVNAVSIQDGDGFLQGEASINVVLNWSTAGDAAFAKVAEGALDCQSASGYVALPGGATTTTFAAVPISAGDGGKIVAACFEDAAGNTATAQDTTLRDSVAPTVTNLACTNCTVDGGALFSTSSSVTVAVTSDEAGSGVASARVVVDGGAPQSIPVLGGIVTIAGQSQAAHSAVIQLVDAAGNTSSGAQAKTIAYTVDSAPPALASNADLTLNGANSGGFTSNNNVTVTVAAAPADTVQMSLVEAASLNCATASYTPFAATSTLVLSAGQGLKSVQLCLKDRAGNVSVSAANASITFDSLPPSLPVSGAVAIQDGGDEFITTVVGGVDVKLSWNTVGDVAAFKLGENTVDCSSGPYVTPGGIGTVNTFTQTAFPLSSGDGLKLVAVCFKDAAGNIVTGQDTTVLDSAAPTATFAVSNGAAFAIGTGVTADFTAVSADVAKMKLATSAPTCSDPTGYVAFANGSSVTLAAPDGAKTVFACLKDGAGNFTASALSDSIVLDTADPAVTFTLTRAGVAGPVAGFTSTLQTALHFASISSDAVAIAIAETSISCATASYEALPQPIPAGFTHAFDLAAGSDGPRTVAVCVKDGAGRTNGVTGTVQTITLDQTLPSVTVQVNAGATVTNTASVTVNLVASPAGDLLRSVFSNDASFDCTHAAFAGAFAVTPASAASALNNSGSGTKFIVGCFQDQAGNVSAAADDIQLDLDRPVINSVACLDCNFVSDPYTNKATAKLAVDTAAPDVSFVITVVHNDIVGTLAQDRACAVNGDCRTAVGETCENIPVDTVGTLGKRCAELNLPTDVTLSLATAAAPIVAAGGSGIANVPVEGRQEILVVLEDSAGNLSVVPPSGAAQAFVRRDVTAPGVTFALNTGAITSQQTVFARNVVVTNEPANPAGVPKTGTFRVSSLNTFADAAALDYVSVATTGAQAFPVTLNAGDGAKTVFLQVTDNAGNVSTVATQNVTLDTTPPNAGALVLAGGATLTNSTTATLAVTGGDPTLLVTLAGDITSGAGTFWFAADQDGAGGFSVLPATVTLKNANASNVVTAFFTDGAGNTSGNFSALITADTTVPPDGTVVLADGATTVNARTIPVSIQDTSADFMKFFEVSTSSSCGVPACNSGGFVPFAPATSFTLSASQGDKRVCWRFCDAAGNGTTTASSDLTLGTFVARPRPILSSLNPNSYIALSQGSFPLVVNGRGIAPDTEVQVGEFTFACTSSGNATCQADADGGCAVSGTCASTCAASCSVNLPDEIMRNSGTYAVRLQTPDPVVAAGGTSAATLFFTVVAPLPQLTSIFPRGVEQTFDSGGEAIPEFLTIQVEGHNLMDNVQFRLGTNFASILSPGLVTGVDGVQRATVVVSSAGVFVPNGDQKATVAQLVAENSGTGGGTDSRAFGLNPAVLNWSSESFTAFKSLIVPATAIPRGPDAVVTRWGVQRNINAAALGWVGENGYLGERAPDGSLLARFPQTGGSVVPVLFNASTIDLEDDHLRGPAAGLTDDARPRAYGGNGTFGVTRTLTLTSTLNAFDATSADINTDGFPDYLLATSDGIIISLSGPEGDPTTEPLVRQNTVTMGNLPIDVAVADVNGDGKPDLLSADFSSVDVSIRLGDGTGNFGSRTVASMPSNPRSLRMGDVNGDGTPDIVTPEAVRLGNGDGTFGITLPISGGSSFEKSVVGDVNNDGVLDIVSIDVFSSNPPVKVRLGLGDGTFATPKNVAMNSTFGDLVTGVALGDLNDDGALDLVVATSFSGGATQGGFTIAFGIGDGNFGARIDAPTGLGRFASVAIADVDGDRRPDIVGVSDGGNGGTGTLAIVKSLAGGTFAAPVFTTFGSATRGSIVVADVDSNGAPDIVAVDQGNRVVRLLEGVTGTALLSKQNLSISQAIGMAFMDMNSDNNPDFVITSINGVSTVQATFPGFFSGAPFLLTGGAGTDREPDIGDFNNDGVPDIVAPMSSVCFGLYPATGNGQFAAAVKPETGLGCFSVVEGDADNDGNSDLFAGSLFQALNTTFRKGNGNGTFGARVDIDLGAPNPNDLVVSDFNNDGKLDVASAFKLRLGNGNGTFGAALPLSTGGGPLAVGDVNNDGREDLVFGAGASVGTELGDGLGGFGAPTFSALAGFVSTVRVAYVDGDPFLDVIVGDGNGATAIIGLGDGTGAFHSVYKSTVGTTVFAAGGVDFTHDGTVDLVSVDLVHASVQVLDTPGSWQVDLTDPDTFVDTIAPGATTTFPIGQAREVYETINASALLDFAGPPAGSVTFVLIAPDGRRVTLATESTFAAFPNVPSAVSFRVDKTYKVGGTVGDLSQLLGLEIAGKWKLEVHNATDTEASLLDWGVHAHVHYSETPVGGSAAKAEKIPMAAGTRGRIIAGTTLGYLDNGARSCGVGAGKPDHFYEFTIPAPNTLTLLGVDTPNDGAVEVTKGACTAPVTIVGGCVDDGWGAAPSRKPVVTNLALTSAGTYCVVVDAFNGSGDYDLHMLFANPL